MHGKGQKRTETCIVSSSSEEDMSKQANSFTKTSGIENAASRQTMDKLSVCGCPYWSKERVQTDHNMKHVRHGKRGHHTKNRKDKKRTKKIHKHHKRHKEVTRKKKKKKQRRKGSSSSSSACSLSPASEFTEALANDKIFLAQYLINKHGVQLCGLGGDGPLHVAARQNKPNFVSWFLTRPGAAEVIDWQNAEGETALLVAAKLLHGRIALRLIEALADPGVIDNAGVAPEAFDLNTLLQETERAERISKNMHNASAIQAPTTSEQQEVAAAKRSHDATEWGQRLFCEMMEDEFHTTHDFFAGCEDLERREESDGDSWIDDIAFQLEERKRHEARACMEERLRAVIQAREEARQQADAQEARARRFARVRAASDAEFQKQWRQSSSAKDAPRASTCSATRAEDDARWRVFEDRIQTFDAATGDLQNQHPIRYNDIPWPSGPLANPLHIHPSGHPAVLRSQIRAGLLRWHPDKFDQRVGRFLPTDGVEREKALARVKEIAQQLNRLMTELAVNSNAGANPPSTG